MQRSDDKSGEQTPGGTVRSMAVGTLVLLAGLMMVDVLPNMLKSLYAEYTQFLVFCYGVFVFSAMAVMLGIVCTGAVGDILSMKDLTAFGWRPGEAYLNGTSRKDKARKSEEQQKK